MSNPLGKMTPAASQQPPEPATPYCPCGGQCHHATHPCSLGCWAAQKPWRVEEAESRAAAEATAAPAGLPHHVRGDWREEGWRDADDGHECQRDGEPWPCEAVRAVAALSATAAPAGLRERIAAKDALLRTVLERLVAAAEHTHLMDRATAALDAALADARDALAAAPLPAPLAEAHARAVGATPFYEEVLRLRERIAALADDWPLIGHVRSTGTDPGSLANNEQVDREVRELREWADVLFAAAPLPAPSTSVDGDSIDPAAPLPAVGETPETVARERLLLARHALVATGYFTEEQVGEDVAPRITELFGAVERMAHPDDRAALALIGPRLWAEIVDRLHAEGAERALAALREPGDSLNPVGSMSTPTAVGVDRIDVLGALRHARWQDRPDGALLFLDAADADVIRAARLSGEPVEPKGAIE